MRSPIALAITPVIGEAIGVAKKSAKQMPNIVQQNWSGDGSAFQLVRVVRIFVGILVGQPAEVFLVVRHEGFHLRFRHTRGQKQNIKLGIRTMCLKPIAALYLFMKFDC